MTCAINPAVLTERSAATQRRSAKIAMMTSSRSMGDRFQDLAIPLLAPLYNHACWLVRDTTEAEDLVQETLTKAFRAFESFEEGTNFKAWVFRILRNTFLTSRAALASNRTVYLEDHPDSAELTDPGSTPESYAIQLDNLAVLRRALEELPPHLREVILLSDLEELKYREIAIVLDVPIGTVMSRLARARQALRKLLESTSGGAA